MNGGPQDGASTFHDTFGSERADADFARSDLAADDGVFLHTAEVEEFLTRDPDYAYVLGTMGSGKSILLLKKWLHLERSHTGVLLVPRIAGRVFTPSVAFATTVRWTSFWQLERNGKHDVDLWTQLWEWALLGCVLSQWSSFSESHGEARVARDIQTLLQNPNLSEDPYDSIARQLEVGEGAKPLHDGHAVLPSSEMMRRFLEKHANEFPPTYVFLDNQDDFFNDAPQFWTASALGCKYAIDQLHRRSAHRVHFFLTLRPEVLWSVSTNADATRHHSDVFRTEWGVEHLTAMFEKRAARLKDAHLQLPNLRLRSPLAAFFGPQFFDPLDRSFHNPVIDNYGVAEERPVREKLMRYLLRHTLHRPRELIIIGNEILRRRRELANGGALTQEIVRDAVASAAHLIALAYIGEIKQRWTWTKQGESAEDAIKRFLKQEIYCNVLPTREIPDIERKFLHSCGKFYDPHSPGPMSVLASAGLLGWPVNSRSQVRSMRQYFPRPGDTPVQVLPKTVPYVLVHPVLYGPEFGIKTKKGIVVGSDELWRDAI